MINVNYLTKNNVIFIFNLIKFRYIYMYVFIEIQKSLFIPKLILLKNLKLHLILHDAGQLSIGVFQFYS